MQKYALPARTGRQQPSGSFFCDLYHQPSFLFISKKRPSALAFIPVVILIDVIGLGVIIAVEPKLIQQLTGEDRGGFTTKLHLSCDAQGRVYVSSCACSNWLI